MNAKELFNKYTKEEDYGCQTCGCTCDCGYTARYMNEEQFTQAIAEIISNPAEPLVMPKIAVLYKQNDIPTDLDNNKLKHYLDWECEKSNLIDFIIEITEVLKTDSNFSA